MLLFRYFVKFVQGLFTLIAKIINLGHAIRRKVIQKLYEQIAERSPQRQGNVTQDIQ